MQVCEHTSHYRVYVSAGTYYLKSRFILRQMLFNVVCIHICNTQNVRQVMGSNLFKKHKYEDGRASKQNGVVIISASSLRPLLSKRRRCARILFKRTETTSVEEFWIEILVEMPRGLMQRFTHERFACETVSFCNTIPRIFLRTALRKHKTLGLYYMLVLYEISALKNTCLSRPLIIAFCSLFNRKFFII